MTSGGTMNSILKHVPGKPEYKPDKVLFHVFDSNAEIDNVLIIKGSNV